MRTLALESVDITFLVSGHSQNENDNAHSVIEGHTRNLTPSLWKTNIQNSFQKNEAIVNVMDHRQFINFKDKEYFKEYSVVFADKIMVEVDDESSVTPSKKKTRFHISNFLKKKETKVMWSQIVQAKFSSKDPLKMLLKYNYDEHYKIVDFCSESSILRKKKTGWELYDEPLGISKKKKDDLLKLCSKDLIPEQHKAFYQEILVNSQKKDDDDVIAAPSVGKNSKKKITKGKGKRRKGK